MKGTWISILVILGLLVVANAASMTIKNIDCTYSNDSGTFTFEEKNFNERTFDMCLRKFEEYKKQAQKDTVLYRLCEKNIFKFWNWGTYLFAEKFQLPYKSWKEIEARRGTLLAKSGFQDF